MTTPESFSDIVLSDKTTIPAIIGQMKLSKLTPVQQKAIPLLLEGKDAVVTAETGSGKTLAFLIPLIEALNRRKRKRNSIEAVIISPTRELSIQTLTVLEELIADHPGINCGIVMGGTNRRNEVERVTGDKTPRVLVATPGRLLDHLQNTNGFSCEFLRVLVLDEADRILAIGFEDDIRQIFRLLPQQPRRQVAFFSATITDTISDLARLAMQGRDDSVFVGCEGAQTVASLNQGYIVIPPNKRLLLLYTFLKRNINSKLIVFFSSCMSVKFHYELFSFVDLKGLMCIHGRQKQAKRTSTFFEFGSAQKGVLLCTDVAARGLDIPEVDWIVQYDPPDDPKEYIHRVGRTARAGARGNALLFLTPKELGLLKYLREAGVSDLNEFEFSWSKIANIQEDLEKLIENNYFLHMSGRDAYKAYVRAYASHAMKDVYDVGSLDLALVAQSFGFKVPPIVSMDVGAPSKRKIKQKTTMFKNVRRKPTKKM